MTDALVPWRRAGLAFITAFAPDKDESVNTLIGTFPQDGPQPPILPPQGGYLFLDRTKFAEAFAADIDPAQAAFMANAQVPWGVDALGATITDPAWRHKPSWYLQVTEDHMIPFTAQQSMAQRAGSTVVAEVPSCHAVYVSHPEVVKDTVTTAARGS